LEHEPSAQRPGQRVAQDMSPGVVEVTRAGANVRTASRDLARAGALLTVPSSAAAKLDGAGRAAVAGAARLPVTQVNAAIDRGAAVVLSRHGTGDTAREAAMALPAGITSAVVQPPGIVVTALWLLFASFLGAAGLLLTYFVGWVGLMAALLALGLGFGGLLWFALGRMSFARLAATAAAWDGSPEWQRAWRRLGDQRVALWRSSIPEVAAMDLREQLLEIESALLAAAELPADSAGAKLTQVQRALDELSALLTEAHPRGDEGELDEVLAAVAASRRALAATRAAQRQ